MHSFHNCSIRRCYSTETRFAFLNNKHRSSLTEIGTKLNIYKLDDWYKVPHSKVQTELARAQFKSLNLYENLCKAFPEKKWQPWLFDSPSIPFGYWKSIQNQKDFLDWLSIKLNVKNTEDWKHVTRKQIEENHGYGLLKRYNGSVSRLLSNLMESYKDLDWNPDDSKCLPWEEMNLPVEFWLDMQNQVQYFDWAAKKLNITSLDDWYNYSSTDIATLGAKSPVSTIYKNSLPRALTVVYKDHKWLIWKFKKVPSGFWKDKENQRAFLLWVMEELNIKEPHGWYNVSYEKISSMGGRSILAMYDESLANALNTLFPEWNLNWDSKKKKQHHGYWEDINTQREFLDNFAKKRNFTSLDNWYDVPKVEVLQEGGAGLLFHHDNSLIKALLTVYNDYAWQPWKFNRIKVATWSNSLDKKETLKQYLEYVAKQLHITQLDDWYRVSATQLASIGGYYSILLPMGGLQQALSSIYPEHNWDVQRLLSSGPKSSNQRHLKILVSTLFPSQEILENYYHPNLINPLTGSKLELDIYLPQLSLAFEYQGQQHYNSKHMFDKVSQKDSEKKKLCEGERITLIAVPYTWDRSIESLKKSIYETKPELLSKVANGNINIT